MSEERYTIKSPTNRKHSGPQNRPPPTSPGVRKAVTLFGVTDLRQLIDKRHQERDGTQKNNGKSPPDDPSYNFLKDPSRDHHIKTSLTGQDEKYTDKKYHQTKQIINSNRFNKGHPNRGESGNVETKVKKELRFENRSPSPATAGASAGMVSDRFPNSGKRNNDKFKKTEQPESLANIKVELSTETGRRNCVMDENTKIPEAFLEHFGTKKSHTSTGYNQRGGRGGRGGGSGQFRGRGRGRGGRGNNFHSARNVNPKPLKDIDLIPNDDTWETEHCSETTDEKISGENNHERKPYNNRHQRGGGSFRGWRPNRDNFPRHRAQGGFNSNNRRQNEIREPTTSRREPKEQEPITTTIPVLDWSTDEQQTDTPTETNEENVLQQYDDVENEENNPENYDAEYENEEAAQEGEGEEFDSKYYSAVCEENTEVAEAENDTEETKNKENFDDSLMMESITVVSSKYEDGEVKRSVTVNETKENDATDEKA